MASPHTHTKFNCAITILDSACAEDVYQSPLEKWLICMCIWVGEDAVEIRVFRRVSLFPFCYATMWVLGIELGTSNLSADYHLTNPI